MKHQFLFEVYTYSRVSPISEVTEWQHRKTRLWVVTALFLIAYKEKCPTDQWISKIWCIHTIKYYLPIKINETLVEQHWKHHGKKKKNPQRTINCIVQFMCTVSTWLICRDRKWLVVQDLWEGGRSTGVIVNGPWLFSQGLESLLMWWWMKNTVTKYIQTIWKL